MRKQGRCGEAELCLNADLNGVVDSGTQAPCDGVKTLGGWVLRVPREEGSGSGCRGRGRFHQRLRGDKGQRGRGISVKAKVGPRCSPRRWASSLQSRR